MRSKILSCLLLLFLFVFIPGALYAQAVKFEYFDSRIYLKVAVNDNDSALFLMDTGANASAIDNTLADKLKLESSKKDTVEGTTGKIVADMVTLEKISVAKAYVDNLTVTKQDLSNILAPAGQKVFGILGTDFLKHFTFTIDFRHHEINFLKIKLNNTAGLRYLPFEMDNGIPRVKVIINGVLTTYLRYDSGASLAPTSDVYVNVTEDNYKKLKAADTSLKPHNYVKATGATGMEIKLPVVSAKSLKNDNGTIDSRSVQMIVQPKQGYFARKDAVGFFGNNLLEKFGNVAVDISSGFMILGAGTF